MIQCSYASIIYKLWRGGSAGSGEDGGEERGRGEGQDRPAPTTLVKHFNGYVCKKR